MALNRKRIVIVGTTSSIAEHCARIWVSESPVELVLIGRDKVKIEIIAADLRVRSPQSDISIVNMNLTNIVEIQAIADQIADAGVIDVVLVAHGTLPDQAKCQNDIHLVSEAIELNGLSPILFIEAFAKHMGKVNKGILAVIGSVAGDRGRKSNYVYGAAKGLVERYMQGLDHRFANTGIKSILIKPGPTNTPMTAHLQQQGMRLADVNSVAKTIVKGIESGKPVIYAPGKWAWIMLVIKKLPRFIFNRMDI